MNPVRQGHSLDIEKESVLLREVRSLCKRHKKNPRFRTIDPDPVNTQLFVHQTDRYETFPSILISLSQPICRKTQLGKSHRRSYNSTFQERKRPPKTDDRQLTTCFKDTIQRRVKLEADELRLTNKFLQIDFLTLKSNYARNMAEAYLPKQTHRTNTIRASLISLPKKPQLPNFIRNYKTNTERFTIDDLVKSPYFTVKFDQNSELYFGDIKEGLRDGKGVLVTNNQIFEGQWAYSQRLQGVQITKKGTYKGKFVKNQRSKVGQFYWNNGQYYSGEWQHNKKHGTGLWKSTKGDVYMGHWFKGKVEGYGIHLTKLGQKYQGFFVDFLKHGQGKEFFPNGDFYEGKFQRGKPEGLGVYTWKNGAVYEGQFKQGLRDGQGVIKKGNMEYTGSFAREKAEGKGRLVVWNESSFKGHFKQGKKEGRGILKEKKRVYVGQWKDNCFIHNPL